MTPQELAELFHGPSTVLAEALLGCRLTVAAPDGTVTVRLTETEAYGGQGVDPGAHSFRGRTERNAALFGPARRTYVYRSYGIHWCLNLVGHPEGEAGGVLLRAGEVTSGRPTAVARRGRDAGTRLLSGPGNLGQGLGISLAMGHLPVEIEGLGPSAPTGTAPARFLLAPPESDGDGAPVEVVRGPRVGVSGEGGSVRFPWRYHLAGEPSVSAFRRGRNVPD